MNWRLGLVILLSILGISIWYSSTKEGFLARLGWSVGFPQFDHDPNVVYTSGTDVLTPFPYWVAYGAPGYWPYTLSPYWYYDVPWYGPVNYPWIGPRGRDHYRPGHGPGYSGVAVGGGGGGGHGGH